MKKVIRLTESDLHIIVKESVKRILRESNENFETWYRGYNSKYGSQKDHLIWLTDDISYARAYGNRVEEVIIDDNKANSVSLYEMDDIFGYEIDYYDGPNKDEAKELLYNGYNCYYFDANSNNSYCMCLWNASPIVSRRELSKEEFNEIELYDGLVNHNYDDDYN